MVIGLICSISSRPPVVASAALITLLTLAACAADKSSMRISRSPSRAQVSWRVGGEVVSRCAVLRPGIRRYCQWRSKGVAASESQNGGAVVRPDLKDICQQFGDLFGEVALFALARPSLTTARLIQSP